MKYGQDQQEPRTRMGIAWQGHLAAPEYHQAVQIKMSWDNVTAGRDEHGKEKYGDRRCRSDSVSLTFLSFQGKDMWKGLSLTERPSHILLWWNFRPPNNTMSCMFQDVIGVQIFSHHGNSALSPHPTASTTQKPAGLFGQRVGVLLTFYFLMHVSG